MFFSYNFLGKHGEFKYWAFAYCRIRTYGPTKLFANFPADVKANTVSNSSIWRALFEFFSWVKRFKNFVALIGAEASTMVLNLYFDYSCLRLD